ncbi:MAG: 3-deoxy-manno-octulosonate cytidylyltransferase [Planctomycetes bacterium]|nr:3-deoxy-manno-octulosonate cytidylyltransferase [Planctomycetota bacterium]
MTPATEKPDGIQALVVLPARIGSTRLARKVLLAETGLPLFVHSARNAAECPLVSRVVVACDDAEVQAAGEGLGIEMICTRPDHPSGTDRVREAHQKVGGNWDVVLNVQADEPDLDPRDLSSLITVFEDPTVQAATLGTPFTDPEEMLSPSVVKVVMDHQGDALYFSRSPIPSVSHSRSGEQEPLEAARRHVGVYAFRPDALATFCTLPLGRLEQAENLEQLRWLEAGKKMRVQHARRAARGIDTRTDYEAFVARWTGALKGQSSSQ